MRTIGICFLLTLMLAACGPEVPATTGIKEWSQVISSAEAFFLKGDSDAIGSHTDFSGVPLKDLSRARNILREWKGASSELRHVSTEVMTPAEFTAREEKDFIERAGRASSLPPTKWYTQPEKLIVFTFVSKDPADKVTRFRWYAGAFQKDGLWYFSTSEL